MKNFFSERHKGSLLDGSVYLKVWEEHVKRADPRLLPRNIKTLWETFNAKRDRLQEDYMSTPHGELGYIAGFLLPNIERTYSIFKKVLKQKSFSKELHILDVGCGPLTATAGFLFALKPPAEDEPSLDIHIHALDLSHGATEAGFSFLEKAKHPKINLHLLKLKNLSKKNLTPRVVLCQNAFNEMEAEERFPLLKKLYQLLTPEGMLLLLEPAQEVHSHAMIRLRDQLIRSPAFGAKGRIVAPCPHLKPCPLGMRPTSRTKQHQDWCWFRHRWDPPKSLAKLSSRNLSVLDHSFVLFQKGVPLASMMSAEKEFHIAARVVSDVIPIPLNVKTQKFLETNSVVAEKKPLQKGEKSFSLEHVAGKVLLCTQQGALEAGLVQKNQKEAAPKRGTALTSLSAFTARVRERSSAKHL